MLKQTIPELPMFGWKFHWNHWLNLLSYRIYDDKCQRFEKQFRKISVIKNDYSKSEGMFYKKSGGKYTAIKQFFAEEKEVTWY